jgi:hypothetical protein
MKFHQTTQSKPKIRQTETGICITHMPTGNPTGVKTQNLAREGSVSVAVSGELSLPSMIPLLLGDDARAKFCVFTPVGFPVGICVMHIPVSVCLIFGLFSSVVIFF